MAIVEIYKGATVQENIVRAYLGETLIFERSAYDDVTLALLAQAVTDGYTAASGTCLEALDLFIVTLKAAGIWALCDVIYLPATNGDSDFACYNLKDPSTFKLTKVNSPTFTSLQGFTGNGSSSYLESTFVPLNDGVNYTLNNAGFGGYLRQLNSSLSEAFIGIQNVNTEVVQTTIRINSGTGLSNSYSTGLNSYNRPSSSLLNLYKNGSFISSGASAASSVPSGNLKFMVRANVSFFSDNQLSFMYLGADLTSQASDIYSAIQTYMTAIGSAV